MRFNPIDAYYDRIKTHTSYKFEERTLRVFWATGALDHHCCKRYVWTFLYVVCAVQSVYWNRIKTHTSCKFEERTLRVGGDRSPWPSRLHALRLNLLIRSICGSIRKKACGSTRRNRIKTTAFTRRVFWRPEPEETGLKQQLSHFVCFWRPEPEGRKNRI